MNKEYPNIPEAPLNPVDDGIVVPDTPTDKKEKRKTKKKLRLEW